MYKLVLYILETIFLLLKYIFTLLYCPDVYFIRGYSGLLKKFNPWAFDERIVEKSGGFGLYCFHTYMALRFLSVSLVLKGACVNIMQYLNTNAVSRDFDKKFIN